MIRQILDDLFSEKINSVLDAGCGSNPVSLAIDCKVRLGIDVDDHGLSNASTKMAAVRGNMVYMDSLFRPKQFDLVVFSDTLEHMTLVDAIQAFEAAKIIGLMVFMFVPENHAGFPHDQGPHRHLHLWSRDALAEFVGRPVRVLEDYHGSGQHAMICLWADDEAFNEAFRSYKL